MERIGEEKEDIEQRKKAIRKKVLTLRDSINADDKAQYDARIREIVTGMAEYREAAVILAYVSYKSEADTTLLIKQALADGKVVFAPKVAGREMEFWKIASLEDLQERYKGIREPIQSISFLEWIKEYRINCIDSVSGEDDKDTIGKNSVKACKMMMWMPGVVFDRERHRIGYGGGFYDRYLNRMSGKTYSAVWTSNLAGQVSLITTALAYSFQVLEQIPHEEHDIKPDLLLTERGIVGKCYKQ